MKTTYTTYTTDTNKEDFDKALSKIALSMFDYLFTVENNGKKEIVPHSNGDMSKKILMTKDKKGLLNETRLNKVCAILNSLLNEKNVNYRVSTPSIDNLKIGDNISFKFVDVDGKEKKISVKEPTPKKEPTPNGKEPKKEPEKEPKKEPTPKTPNGKEPKKEPEKEPKKEPTPNGKEPKTNEVMNEKSVLEFLNSLKDFTFIIKFLENKGYTVTKK